MIDVTAMLIASMVKYVIQMVNATNTVHSPVVVCQLITAIGNLFLELFAKEMLIHGQTKGGKCLPGEMYQR